MFNTETGRNMKRQLTPDLLETDAEFGAFVAQYDFRHERTKYLGALLLTAFGTLFTAFFLIIPLLGIPLLLYMLWTLWRCIKLRLRVSQHNVFLYQSGIRVFLRGQESRVAGRDLVVWQKNISMVRGSTVQKTNYHYLVRLPHGNEFAVETFAFGEALCQLIVRTQLGEMLNRFDRGESLTFGAIHLTPEAIYVKTERMGWDQSPKFKIRDGKFYLPLKLFFPSVKCSEIPNLYVLLGILQDNDYFMD